MSYIGGYLQLHEQTYPAKRGGAREPVGQFRVVDVVSVDADERVVWETFIRAQPVIDGGHDAQRELHGGRARRHDVEHQTGRYLWKQSVL